MENLKRKKKKALTAKISILLAIILIVSLLGVVVAQSVRLAKINSEIEAMKNIYQSQAEEEE